MSHPYLRFVGWVLFACGIDQLTKYYIIQTLDPSSSIEIIPGLFNLTLAFNRGAAFGLLADLQDGVRQLVLGLTTAAALLVVLYFLLVEYRHDRVARWSLALVLGGAIGNIIDRIRIGMVIDFLDFYVGENHWPAFNAADSFICIGVVLLIFRRPRMRDQEPRTETSPVSPTPPVE